MKDLNFSFLKRKNNILKKDNSKFNPEFYWKIILYITFAIIIGSFAFGFIIFMQMNTDYTDSPEASSAQTNLVKTERVEKVLKIFSDRENKSNGIINSPSTIIDPSL